jgi:hypothetical protein
MRQYGLLWVLLLVAAVGVAPVIAWVLEQSDVSAVTQAVTALSGALSALAVLVRLGVSWATRALDRVEVAEQRVRERVRDTAAAQAAQIAQVQQHIEVLRREQLAVAAERDAAARQIRTLEERLGALTPGRLLAQFLEERSESGDYRKHLGLTAIVRRDFERLSALVASYNESLTRATAPEQSGPTTDFNRVVLYVDDLDRCPPRRVVEVLQAVHLLLSFPIFVVVVAVDPRWLSQSLQSEYSDLLGTAARHVANQASAQDYLEKIFQIPFSLAPLDLRARNKFVDELLAGEDVTTSPDHSHADRDGEPERGPDGMPGRAALTPRAQQPDTDDEPAGDGTTVPAPAPHGSEQARPGHFDDADEEESVDLEPSSLRLTRTEQAFFDVVMPVLDTSPRGLKRYVNVYRLIKSIAGIDGQGHDGTVGPAAHEAAMTLLALQSGLPTVGPGIVGAVAAADAGGSSETVPGGARLGDAVREWLESRDWGPEGADEGARVLVWLDANEEIASWSATALSPTARHVRVYAFG